MTDAVVLARQPAPEAIGLRHLGAFVAVAEELNFSRGRRAAVRQPARAEPADPGAGAAGRLPADPSLDAPGRAHPGWRRPARPGSPAHRGPRRAVTATRSAGGEHSERLTRLWVAFVEVNSVTGNMAGVRSAVEALHAKFAPPAEVEFRAANTGGVPALLGTQPDAAGGPVLFLHGGGYVSGSSYGYRHLAGALAMVARRPVLVPEFRLVPEHPVLEGCLSPGGGR